MERKHVVLTVGTAAGLAFISALTAPAMAGNIFVGTLAGGDSVMTGNFSNAGLAGSGVSSGLIRQFQVTGQTGNKLDFGNTGVAGASTGTFANTPTTLGSFYLNVASGLGDNWFNTTSGVVRPSDSTVTLAFGQNSGFTAKDLTIDFDPGVAAFGFSFNDVGDHGGSFFVTFNDGSSDSYSSSQRSGFLAIIADSGKEITSVRLVQSTTANDGISAYGFTTMAVVPLPPAAWAGLFTLAGIAGVRCARRRH